MKALILPVVLGALTIVGCGSKPEGGAAEMASGKPVVAMGSAPGTKPSAAPAAMVSGAAVASAAASGAAMPLASAVAPPAASSRAQQIELLDSVDRAIAFARPDMSDTVDTESPGTTLLARWAAKKMKLADVALAKDETSFDAIAKNAGAERGKRMCVKGPIANIEVAHTEGGDVGNGSLLGGGKHVAYFKAVGDRGDLAAKKGARFCGVVIGNHDYKNASGAVSHAVAIVGMFDLAASKK